MPPVNRGFVWSLLTAIIILLIGLMGLLYVSYNRDKQYQTEIQSLRQKLTQKDEQIDRLRSQIRPSTTNLDTSWVTEPDTTFR